MKYFIVKNRPRKKEVLLSAALPEAIARMRLNEMEQNLGEELDLLSLQEVRRRQLNKAKRRGKF